MTLTEFLLARIAEDEASIADMVRYGDHSWWGEHRMSAECEAKRRLATAAQCPREKQVRDVGARDEQHDDGDSGHPQQCSRLEPGIWTCCRRARCAGPS